jgi:enoyl-CoA hydratase/carnithine racemase
MILTERISTHILWAKINRPNARNAINFQVIDQLEALVSTLEKDESIRVFIFSGEGSKSFVAGGDLKEFHNITQKNEAVKVSERMQNLFKRIEALPCWNIAFINGDAYGGGIELMMAFDFILSAPDTQFGFTQGRFYLTPGWGGLTRLIEKVGRPKALEWQGKAEIKTADQLLDENFINAIVEEKDILNWSEPLTNNGRDFIKALKENSGLQSTGRYKKMKSEIELFSELWVDENHTSRVEKFIQKNKKKTNIPL